jgi:hypothetical protein
VTVLQRSCYFRFREDDSPVVWDGPSAVGVNVRPQLHSDPSSHEPKHDALATMNAGLRRRSDCRLNLTYGSNDMSSSAVPPHAQAWRLVGFLNAPVLIVGFLAALAGHRWGAYLLVVDLVVQIGGHLLLGWWAYREAMTRPWPKVAALTDDDWDS